MTTKELGFRIYADDGDALKSFSRISATAKREMGTASKALDDTRSAGKKLADSLSNVADELQGELNGLSSAADRLGESLGPELADRLGRSGIENMVRDFRRAGLTFEEIEADVDSLAGSIKRLDSIETGERTRQGFDDVEVSARKTGDEIDRSRSVLANFVGNAAQDLPGVGSAFGALNVAVGQFAEYATEGGIAIGGLLKTAAPIAVLTAGIPLLTKVLGGLGDQQEIIAKRSKEVSEALTGETQRLIEAGDGATAAAIGYAALGRALLDTGDDGDKFRRALVGVGISTEDAATTLIKLKQGGEPAHQLLLDLASTMSAKLGPGLQLTGKGLEDFVRKIEESDSPDLSAFGSKLEGLGGSLEELQDQAEKVDLDKTLRESILDTAAAFGDAGEAALELAERTTGLGRNGTDLLPLYTELAKILGENAAKTDDVTAAYLAADPAAAGLAAVLGDVGAGLDEGAKAAARAKRQTELLDLAWQGLYDTLDAADAIDNLDDAFADAQKSAKEAFDAAQKGAADAAEKAEAYDDDVRNLKRTTADYAREVLGLPQTQTTEILAMIDAGDLAKVQDLLDKLTRLKALGAGMKTLSVSRSDYLVRATGGVAGGPTLVHQDEVLDLPPGTRVSPVHSAEAAAARAPQVISTTTVNQYFPTGITPESVVDADRRWRRRNGEA